MVVGVEVEEVEEVVFVLTFLPPFFTEVDEDVDFAEVDEDVDLSKVEVEDALPPLPGFELVVEEVDMVEDFVVVTTALEVLPGLPGLPDEVVLDASDEEVVFVDVDDVLVEGELVDLPPLPPLPPLALLLVEAKVEVELEDVTFAGAADVVEDLLVDMADDDDIKAEEVFLPGLGALPDELDVGEIAALELLLLLLLDVEDCLPGFDGLLEDEEVLVACTDVAELVGL